MKGDMEGFGGETTHSPHREEERREWRDTGERRHGEVMTWLGKETKERKRR